MEQIAGEGIDFQLFSVPHHCNKPDKYLSRLFTCDTRPCSKTPLKTRLFPICLRMEQVCYGSFSMGTLAILSRLKTLVQLFMPFLKIAKLALNSTSAFSLLTVWECTDVCV